MFYSQMARILLFTGKGGTGKTTMAAATALVAADQGKKTVVMSTDPAHSLGDSLDRVLGPEPIKILPDLWAQELNILYNVKKYWNRVLSWLAAALIRYNPKEARAEDMAILPGMEELANLLWIYDHNLNNRFELIVVDCPPTGESLRFFSFPKIGEWWAKKLLPLQRKGTTLLRPFVDFVSDVPLPDDKTFDAMDDLMNQLKELDALLIDSMHTSIRLVLNLDKMTIRETQRAFNYFNLFGYPIDAIICNRFIPDELFSLYGEGWKGNQVKYLKFIEELFSPVPIFRAPLLGYEAIGIENLLKIGYSLYGERDPTEIFFRGNPISIEKEGDDRILSLELPFIGNSKESVIRKEDISIERLGEELIVSIGNQKRSFFLPSLALMEREPKGARIEKGRLLIRFGKRQQE